MEENGDREDREEKKDEVKGEERDKNAQETFSCIMYTDKVSNMVFIMMSSLTPNMLEISQQLCVIVTTAWQGHLDSLVSLIMGDFFSSGSFSTAALTKSSTSIQNMTL